MDSANESDHVIQLIWAIVVLLVSWPASKWILNIIRIDDTWVKRLFLALAILSVGGNLGAMWKDEIGTYPFFVSISLLGGLIASYILMKHILIRHPDCHSWRWLGYISLTVVTGYIILFVICAIFPPVFYF